MSRGQCVGEQSGLGMVCLGCRDDLTHFETQHARSPYIGFWLAVILVSGCVEGYHRIRIEMGLFCRFRQACLGGAKSRSWGRMIRNRSTLIAPERLNMVRPKKKKKAAEGTSLWFHSDPTRNGEWEDDKRIRKGGN